MKITKSAILPFLLLFCGLGLSLAAHDKTQKKAEKSQQAEKKFLAKGDGVTTCPVSGEKLESKNISAEFYGRTVYFCCADCLAAAKKNPELYVKKTEAEQIEAVKNVSAKAESHHDHSAMTANAQEKQFLGKGDGIDTCPVTGEKVDKNIKTEIQGRTVYVCCADCLEAVKKHPELYLKWAKAQ